MNVNVYGKITIKCMNANGAIIDMKINVSANMMKITLIVRSVIDESPSFNRQTRTNNTPDN